MKKVENGELVYVDLGQHQGKCAQSGIRPCLVVGSYYASDALNVLPLTKHITKKFNPMHIRINRDDVKGYLANDYRTKNQIFSEAKRIYAKRNW